MTRKALATFALLCAIGTALPDTVAASPRTDIIEDCQDGVLDGSYTPAQLRDARQNLPSDVAQYTDCETVIRAAEVSDRPGSSGGGTGAGQVPGATGIPAQPGVADDSVTAPDERDAPTLAQAREEGAQPSLVDPETLEPVGAVRLDRASATLPAPLVVALGLVVLVGLLLLAPGVRRRLRRASAGT